MKRLLILGAGITGLTIHHLLKQRFEITLLEKTNTIGGLCNSFEINGFWFDYGAHAAFTNNDIVKDILEKNVEVELSISEAMNYKDGFWIKQPVQNNLFYLSTDEKISIIKDFVTKEDDFIYENYGDWLKKKYGNYFAINYPYLYTKKYWTVSPEKLGTKWIGPRMYIPSLDEILRGAFNKETPNVNYSGEIRYPQKGGFLQFLNNIMADKSEIICNADIKEIDIENKILFYNAEQIQYDEIVSTIPLPEIIGLIKDVPTDILNASKSLAYTSLILVSLGIKKSHIIPNNSKCFYVYDEDKIISRAYSTSSYGSKNAPKGCSTIQAEVYYSKFKQLGLGLKEIEDEVIREFIDMNIFRYEDIVVNDIREKKYANIIFTKDIYENRNKIHNYLKDNDIKYAGRFGEWDYLWSDQSVESAINVSDIIKRCAN